MRRLIMLLGFVLLVVPTPALAHHSMVGGADCGTYETHVEQDMTKGRTDSMLYSVDHRVGCKRLIMTNIVGTGRGEAYGYSGQESNCQRFGKEDTVNFFRYYFDTEISADDVKVGCRRYVGPD